MSPFSRGFLKKAKECGVNISTTMIMLEKYADESLLEKVKDIFYPATKSSLFDLAYELEPKIVDSKHKDLLENLTIAKHIAAHGLVPGAAGAGAGSLVGAIVSKDKKKGATKGAIIGGLIGFGSGALNDSYNLANNTRNELLDTYNRSLDKINKEISENANKVWPFKADEKRLMDIKDRITKTISNLKDTSWIMYFSPDHIVKKL